MKDRTKVTPEQEAIISAYEQKARNNWCKQYDDDYIREHAKAMYVRLGAPAPAVIIADSPVSMTGAACYWRDYWSSRTEPTAFDEKWMQEETDKLDLLEQFEKGGGANGFHFSVGQRWRFYAQQYMGVREANKQYPDENLEFNDADLDLFFHFNEAASTWISCEKVIFVSRNPIVFEMESNDALGRDGGGEPHCENGPWVAYQDGWEQYAINGVVVPKNVVMEPETQTIEEIRAEENEEVRRIRIDRYGWSKYLLETGAEPLDIVEHDKGRLKYMEALFRSSDGSVVLCTYDPSTGRPYALEVSPDCTTCYQAQAYLHAGEDAFEGIDVPTEFKYPVARA